MPNEYLKKESELIKVYGLKIIDLSDIKMDDDCYKSDGDHLTEKGALITTRQFNDYLKHNPY